MLAMNNRAGRGRRKQKHPRQSVSLNWLHWICAWFCAVMLLGCQAQAPNTEASSQATGEQELTSPEAPANAAQLDSAPHAVMVFGDSLSAGFGMASRQAWPALLERKTQGLGFRVVNASVSGETSAGGLARLPALLEAHRPRVLVLALGANDGLRGLAAAELEANLMRMCTLAKQAGVARVLLVGMRMPPNFGAEYSAAFEASFVQAAKLAQVDLLPFLLQPIALDDSKYQPDRLHPNEEAQAAIAEHVFGALAPLLKSFP
jgi:acyl-CoA thioesterase-1